MQVRNSYTVRCLIALLVCSWIVLSLTLPGLAQYEGNDEARKIVVDPNGNVIITGRSWNGANFDFVTIKYDKDGNWVWGKRYNGYYDGDDEPAGLAVDTGGNVYVTGSSWGAFGDYVTIKYDANGNWVWGRRYATIYGDAPRALAVDADGNVIVTGYTGGLLGSPPDYLTLKYDLNGNLVWEQRFDRGPGTQRRDLATALAVDAGGNIYVTGQAWSNWDSDYYTIKYDKDGNLGWGQWFNGYPGEDVPTAIGVDDTGNVYITGISDYDYVTIKYGANGTWVWGRRYNGPANGSDWAKALAVDAVGNVCVTGRSGNGAPVGGYDYVTIKYDAAGNWVWGQRYNDPDNGGDDATALSVDAGGNAIVTGNSWNGANEDYVTIKYNAAGVWLWGRRYNGPANESDYARALAVDAGGNVYVTGHSSNGANYDYVTIKYDANGAWVWGARFDGGY